jgi:hypothetical protein
MEQLNKTTPEPLKVTGAFLQSNLPEFQCRAPNLDIYSETVE